MTPVSNSWTSNPKTVNPTLAWNLWYDPVKIWCMSTSFSPLGIWIKKQGLSPLIVIQNLYGLAPTFINFSLINVTNNAKTVAESSLSVFIFISFGSIPYVQDHSPHSLWKALKNCSYSTLNPKPLLPSPPLSPLCNFIHTFDFTNYLHVSSDLSYTFNCLVHLSLLWVAQR